MADYAFHPDALLEYADAASYYLREASPTVAERFVAAVESAMASILAAPDRWRVVEEPGIRRYVFSRFPYVLYYRLGCRAAVRDSVRGYALQPRTRILETTNRLTMLMLFSLDPTPTF
jgi:plasmid stabilization system protein ParE